MKKSNQYYIINRNYVISPLQYRALLLEMQKKNILIYSNTGLSSTQIGLTAEVFEALNTAENELKVVLCDNELPNCYFNRNHNLAGCIACQSRLHKVLDLTGIPVKNRYPLKQHKDYDKYTFPIFENLKALLDYKYNGIDIGRGVASSIISYYRDYEVNSEKFGDLIALELKKAMLVLDFFEDFIEEHSIDEIYLFNGRFAEVRPLMKYAQAKDIPFYTIESGTLNHYHLYKNCLPHSIENNTLEILDSWENADMEERIEIAKEFFINRRSGNEKLGLSFTKKQQKDLLPNSFDFSKKNIAIFNSSEDEFKVITEWETSLYKDQNEAIFSLVERFKNEPDYHFYLRIHPNLIEVDNQQIRELENYEQENLSIILPNDNVDSYCLIDSCAKTLCFGSTMGAEANYWGKPSILYGNSFYMNLDCTYTPNSFEELVELILDDHLKTKDNLGSLKYGYYLSTFGSPTQIIEFENGKVSKIKDEDLKTFYANSLGLGLRYAGNIKQWFKAHKIYFGENLKIKDVGKYK